MYKTCTPYSAFNKELKADAVSTKGNSISV